MGRSKQSYDFKNRKKSKKIIKDEICLSFFSLFILCLLRSLFPDNQVLGRINQKYSMEIISKHIFLMQENNFSGKMAFRPKFSITRPGNGGLNQNFFLDARMESEPYSFKKPKPCQLFCRIFN
jgi:hypothetical protein